MRNFDKTMGRVVVFVPFLLLIVIAGVLAVAGLSSRKADERLFGVGAAAFMLTAGSAMMLGIFALKRAANRPSDLLATLEALRTRLGGETHFASLFSPIVQPRLVTFVRGREVEIRAFRKKASLLGLALGIPRWFFFVTARAAPRAEVYLVGATWARETRVGLMGRSPVQPPRPLLNNIAAYAREPQGAFALLSDPEILGRMEMLAQLPAVQSVGITPSPLGGLGVIVNGGLTRSHDAEHFAWMVEQLVALSERVG